MEGRFWREAVIRQKIGVCFAPQTIIRSTLVGANPVDIPEVTRLIVRTALLLMTLEFCGTRSRRRLAPCRRQARKHYK
jgi:hypothetical protein